MNLVLLEVLIFMALSILNYDQVLMTTGSLTLHNKLLFLFYFCSTGKREKEGTCKENSASDS